MIFHTEPRRHAFSRLFLSSLFFSDAIISRLHTRFPYATPVSMRRRLFIFSFHAITDISMHFIIDEFQFLSITESIYFHY